MNRSRVHRAVATLSLLLLAAGCQTPIPQQFKSPEAEVSIPFEGDEAKVKVSIAGFGANEHARAGISALQVRDYEGAIKEWEAAVAESPKSKDYHFALAVAAEAAGKFDAAKEHYLAANQLAGGSGHYDALAGLKRLEARKR